MGAQTNEGLMVFISLYHISSGIVPALGQHVRWQALQQEPNGNTRALGVEVVPQKWGQQYGRRLRMGPTASQRARPNGRSICRNVLGRFAWQWCAITAWWDGSRARLLSQALHASATAMGSTTGALEAAAAVGCWPGCVWPAGFWACFRAAKCWQLLGGSRAWARSGGCTSRQCEIELTVPRFSVVYQSGTNYYALGWWWWWWWW